jgi:hypothetical protein
LQWSCPGRHAEHRAHNAGFLAGRSLAATKVCGSARAVSDCLASLRPSERAKASCRCSEAECGSEWSGCKAGESVIGRGRNSAEAVRTIWRPAPARTAALGVRSAEPQGGAAAPKRKCPLCDARVGGTGTHETDRTNLKLSGGTPANTRETRVLQLKRGAQRRAVQSNFPRERQTIDA